MIKLKSKRDGRYNCHNRKTDEEAKELLALLGCHSNRNKEEVSGKS